MTIPAVPVHPSAPLLRAARLTLRAHRPDDLAACKAMRSDPSVMRFIGDGQPEDEETVWSRILRAAGHWPLLGYGMWCVVETASGRYVGDVGFMHLKRAMTPSLGDVPEIGWVIAAGAQGRGYAAEAVAATLAWSDANVAAALTKCIIVPAHERSIRLAERAGYLATGTADYKSKTVTVFTRPRAFPSGLTDPTS